MTRGVHGGYDQAVFLDQQLASLLARFSFALAPTGPTPFGGAGPPAPDEQARGTLSLTPRFRYLYFTTEPTEPLRPWASGAARPWPLERRTETDTVTLVVEIQAEIFLSGIRVGTAWVDVAQGLADLDQQIAQEPDPQRQEELRRQREELRRAWTAPLRGYLRITDRVEPRRLIVHRERTDPSITVEAWCAVIDFRPDAGRGHPQIRVWLDPLATFGSPNAASLALQAADPNLVQLAGRIATELPARLSSLNDWRMPESGLTALSITPLLGSPRDPTNLVVRTLPMPDATPADSSCLVLLSRITSPEGDAAFAGRALTVNVRTLRIAVAHQFLLRGLILPALLAGLPGVAADDFSAGLPLLLRYPVDLQGADPPTRLRSVLAYVDEAQTIRIGVAVTIYHPLFEADATGEVSITFAAATTVRDGLPVLRITPTIAATASVGRIQIAWWAAMLLGIGGVWIIVGPILNHIFQDQVRNGLEESLAQPSDPIDAPLPGGVEFTVSDVNLWQESAEFVSPLFLPVMRAHDLIVTLDAVALPQTLDISCVTPDAADPGGRLDAVGGVLPNGSRWGLPIDDAIAAAQAGTTFVSVAPDGSRAEVRVVEQEGRPPFLQTVPDASTANNLLNLPPCP